jgi:Na+/glutamate symporter
LTSLAWLLGLLLTAALWAVRLNAPEWLLALLAVLAVITVGVYLYAYVYFMKHDSEALRSERYSLGKLAINKGVAGDDLAGIIEVEPSVPGEPGIVPRGRKGPSRQ